eukprot:1187600-Rhodomonas_salina.3
MDASEAKPRRLRSSRPPHGPTTCYALSSTDVAYAATRALCEVRSLDLSALLKDDETVRPRNASPLAGTKEGGREGEREQSPGPA